MTCVLGQKTGFRHTISPLILTVSSSTFILPHIKLFEKQKNIFEHFQYIEGEKIIYVIFTSARHRIQTAYIMANFLINFCSLTHGIGKCSYSETVLSKCFS